MSQARESSRESQCDGKTAYRSKKIAKASAASINARCGGGRLVVYRCPWCGSWHIGHAVTEWGAVSDG